MGVLVGSIGHLAEAVIEVVHATVIFAVTCERIRQIEAEALRRLRHSLRFRPLRALLNEAHE
jgi:hypothetical protein